MEREDWKILGVLIFKICLLYPLGLGQQIAAFTKWTGNNLERFKMMHIVRIPALSYTRVEA